MKIDVVDILKHTVPFNFLRDDVLEDIGRTSEVKNFSRGAYILKQGKKGPPTLFIVARGSVEIVVADERNEETGVGFRHQHDFFGITSVLTQKSYPASVRALEDLTCILIPGKKMEELMITHPLFSGHFTGILSERLRLLYREVIVQQSYEAHSTTESPLLRKRVSEIMTTSPVICQYRTPVADVAKLMVDRRVGSVVVVDDKDYPIGLVRERDLVHKVMTRASCQMENLTAGMVMDEKLIKLQMGAFYNQALLAVIKHQITHMVVMDDERLVGVLALRDLVNTRSTGSLWVTDKIETAKDLDHLSQIGQEVDDFLYALVAERASVPELFDIITEMHDRLLSRIIELCEQEVARQGYGSPPVEYCWINMGSAGRKEQILRTDQDNAIIYADSDHDHREYFHILGSKVVEELVRAGFAPCKGDVMASNPKWCHSLSGWKKVITRWFYQDEDDSIRMLTIFLDCRPSYGSRGLSRQIWEHVFDGFQDSLGLTHSMTEDELVRPVPLNVLGNFVTGKKSPHKNEINLKYVCRHIINCFRVFAVRNRISETSTLGRIERVVKIGIISEEDGVLIRDAFETLMMLAIRENVSKVKQSREADNYINPYRLNKTEQLLLKGAFSAISRLQKITSDHFTDYTRRALSSGI
jgi:CBS domain-containing protein